MSPRAAQNPGVLRNTLATGLATRWKGGRRTVEFFREVTTRNDQGCWVWPGHLDKGGYGKARFSHPENKKEFAHRVAWSAANGRAKGHRECRTCIAVAARRRAEASI